MLGSFFRQRQASPGPAGALRVVVHFDSLGYTFALPGTQADAWIAHPQLPADPPETGARLAMLVAEGHAVVDGPNVRLPWASLYALKGAEQFSGFLDELGIHSETSLRPRLVSRGALMDGDFAVVLDGWTHADGLPAIPAPKLIGRVLQLSESAALVSSGVNALLDELQHFNATPAADRSQSFKERAFGRMRRLALVAGCQVSDYVARTVILTPERLRLGMRTHGHGQGKVVEIIPGFDDEPANWLALFDRLPLRDSYDVPEGHALTRIVVSSQLRTVLAEIKHMPGRRVAGDRAQAFMRNPLALLGDAACDVIDAEDFVAARNDAGIFFHTFAPLSEHGPAGQILRVGVNVQAVGYSELEPRPVWFDGPQELDDFICRVESALFNGSPCVTWAVYELEIDGDTEYHLDQLARCLRDWAAPALWTAAEVLDLSNYADRVEAIGVEKPFVVPVIARRDESGGWFQGNVETGWRVGGNGDTPPVILPIKFEDIPSLQEAVRQAETQQCPAVRLPGLEQPVPIGDAKRAIAALAKLEEDLGKDQFKPGKGKTEPSQRLIIKRNLDAVDYTEGRATELLLPDGAQPVVPASLRSSIELKPHQRVGVAWLQHLWSLSPHHCRGTLLADDMGLGKTLQLLAFMAAAFEADPSLPPALVVAPVALLENWRNELDRFFEAGTMPLLMLYGENLRALRASKAEIDAELKSQGVTRLLKRNWVGDARLVLTTYETLRDLEFALSMQHWSIMVCDEAQKIKTPAALVTRAAKKQKVRFRVACTGTPVENTLADLWCLFDFVQPGMLGALNQFSRIYRQPIEAKTDAQRAKVEELRGLIQPQILHRKRAEVVRDLPPTVDDSSCKRLSMSEYQQELYEGALSTLRNQHESNPSAQLQALLAIRQICSDPHGFAEQTPLRLPIDRLLNESPKLAWLVQRLKDLAADESGDHKLIVFCEFRELQIQLQRVIAAFFGMAPSIVNGDTSADPSSFVNRQGLIDAFQKKPGFNAIILSPLAVGFGVNIQAANHVVHFTRTWNPAKEDQATARAHRIGQTRTVTVYYPGVVSDRFPSFDQRLDALLSNKRALAGDILNGCGDLKVSDFADLVG
jgi:hypothetical protein